MDNWKCLFCGETNAADATHCSNCGTVKSGCSASVSDVKPSVSATESGEPVYSAVSSEQSTERPLSQGNEELLIFYSRFMKGFAILLYVGGFIGGIVAIAEDEAWTLAIIIPGVILLTLPLFLMAATIRVYCNMSLNLSRINCNLQKIVNSKNL